MSGFDNISIEGFIKLFNLLIPLLMLFLVLVCLIKKAPVYDAFVEGAGQGIKTVLSIAPFVIAMTTLVALFRASGLERFVTEALRPVTKLGLPSAVLPMALIRPLSGSAALAMLQDIIKIHGPDSYEGLVAATLMGSTETIFYTVALYFGSVGIKKPRYTIPAALLSCVAGTAASVWICSILF